MLSDIFHQSYGGAPHKFHVIDLISDLPQSLRENEALAGYAEHLTGLQTDVKVKLFRYSEHEKLDTKVLEAHLSSSGVSEVSVLLLATGQSSYLWFQKDHGPRTLELCTIFEEISRTQSELHCMPDEPGRKSWMAEGATKQWQCACKSSRFLSKDTQSGPLDRL